MALLSEVEKLPPQSIEAEQSTLGAMLIEKEALAKVIEVLKPSDFYKESHQLIFSAVFKLFEKGEAVDLITLTDELKKHDSLDKAGGAAYLTLLIDSVPTAANVEYYANIIKEKSDLRSLIYAGTDIARMGYEAKEPVEQVLDKSEQLIFSITQRRTTRDFVLLKQVLTGTFEKINELYEKKSYITGIPTGFKELDKLSAGLQSAELIVVAARPSIGKTAICLNIASHAAIHEKKTVAIFSLEMSKDQLVQRLICSEAQVNAQKFRTGYLEEGDWPNITSAIALLSEAPIFIDDTPDITVMEMRSKARRLKAKYGLDFLIVDYLQMIRGHQRAENRNQEISEISRQLKNLAKELNIPVVAVSQLSRAVESRADKRPLLSDLRESGAIEQEADLVAFIYRDDFYNPQTEKKNIAEIIVAKQRNGPVGTIELVFLKEYTRFVDLERFREE